MADYYDVLVRVEAIIAALSITDIGGKPAALTIRKEPVWIDLQDRWPQIVVAPRDDLHVEEVGVDTGNGTLCTRHEGFKVFVGLGVNAEFALEMLDWRVGKLQQMWNALSPSTCLRPAISTHYMTVTNGTPGGMKPPPTNVDAAWLEFTYIATRDVTA